MIQQLLLLVQFLSLKLLFTAGAMPSHLTSGIVCPTYCLHSKSCICCIMMNISIVLLFVGEVIHKVTRLHVTSPHTTSTTMAAFSEQENPTMNSCN
ncbi:hypothetical protein KC19_3G266300, partial [Ceratodon purpureus]